MIRYCALMFTLLAGAVVVTALVTPPLAETRGMSCRGVADYPVQRLADWGDVGAMAYLGERMLRDGCDAQARAQGLQYLEPAAAAGHVGAVAYLMARRGSMTDHRSPVSACTALLAMVLPGVDDPHLMRGACD